MDTPLNGCGLPHFFIPSIVIQELHNLKVKQTCDKILLRSVSEAIFFLNSVLGKHPRFHQQSCMEVKAWKSFSENNDEQILECCLGLSGKMPKEKVILWTNDKNLVNKCLILKIDVRDWKCIRETARPHVEFRFSENVMKATKKKRKRNRVNNKLKKVSYKKRKTSQVSSNNGSANKVAAVSENDQQILQDPSIYKQGSANKVAAVSENDQQILQDPSFYKQEIHTIMDTVQQLLKDNLSILLDTEMHETYESSWLSFPVKRDLLDEILAAILKYWKMVFSTFMTEKDKRIFELLHGKVNQPTGLFADEKEDCLVILSSIQDVFCSIKRKRPNMKIPVERIQECRVALIDCFYKYDKSDSASKQAQLEKSVLDLFDANWNFINLLNGIVLDTCDIPHDFQYDKPNRLLTAVEVRQVIVVFYPTLEQLKNQMFEMHTAIQECKPIENISKLSETLLNFIPSVNSSIIEIEPFTSPHFSARALELFCTNPQNRRMIEVGCKQVQKFFVKLDEALVALLLLKKLRI